MFVVISTLPILFFLCSFIPVPSKSFTSLPSASLIPVPSHSHQPSFSESPSAPIVLGSTTSPETEDSMSRSTIVGLAFGLTLTVAVAYAVLVNHRSGAVLVNKDPPKDANNVGVASHEPWGKTHSSLPLSYMGLNNSMSASSSSSFRDYRFVSVFGPQGNIIPQFNPDKAGAVVLGSICIGGAESSSFSSGPFSNAPGSPSYSTTKSFFSRRRGLESNSIGAFPTASKDDMSSLSSHQSSSFRNNPKYKTMNRRKRYFPIGRYKSSQSSTHSRSTIPMTHQRQQKIQHMLIATVKFQLEIGRLCRLCRNSIDALVKEPLVLPLLCNRISSSLRRSLLQSLLPNLMQVSRLPSVANRCPMFTVLVRLMLADLFYVSCSKHYLFEPCDTYFAD